jgi:hypothetical protein
MSETSAFVSVNFTGNCKANVYLYDGVIILMISKMVPIVP